MDKLMLQGYVALSGEPTTHLQAEVQLNFTPMEDEIVTIFIQWVEEYDDGLYEVLSHRLPIFFIVGHRNFHWLYQMTYTYLEKSDEWQVDSRFLEESWGGVADLHARIDDEVRRSHEPILAHCCWCGSYHESTSIDFCPRRPIKPPQPPRKSKQ